MRTAKLINAFFCSIDSTISLLSNSEISSLWPSSVTVQPGLCQTRSETRVFVSHDVAQLCSQNVSFVSVAHLNLGILQADLGYKQEAEKVGSHIANTSL